MRCTVVLLMTNGIVSQRWLSYTPAKNNLFEEEMAEKTKIVNNTGQPKKVFCKISPRRYLGFLKFRYYTSVFCARRNNPLQWIVTKHRKKPLQSIVTYWNALLKMQDLCTCFEHVKSLSVSMLAL